MFWAKVSDFQTFGMRILLTSYRGSEKVGLKLNIQKTKIMASDPITSWEIDGETASDFIFLGSKITADGDCSHEIKRGLLLGLVWLERSEGRKSRGEDEAREAKKDQTKWKLVGCG